jgi:hypothetical protein
MRPDIVKTSLSLLLLILTATLKVNAQDAFLQDRTLSQLRGVWEYRTYRDKWTLVFESDHSMLLDREPADYTLVPGAIRVHDRNGSIDYPYNLDGNDLSLTLADGSNRTYRKTDAGEGEQTVHGTYFSLAISSVSRESFYFDGDHSFAFVYSSSGDSSQNPANEDHGDRQRSVSETGGVYRVEGEKLILAFDDATISELRISGRDDDNSVADILFQDQVFETDRPVAPAAPEQPITAWSPIPLPIPVPGPPPPCCCPAPGPPPPGNPIAPPVHVAPAVSPSTDKKAGQAESKSRDFGTTRGMAGAR